MINLQWGTGKNGQLDTSALDDVSGRGDFMESTAAHQFLAMRQACHDATGVWLNPAPGSSCYRPMAIQQSFYAAYTAYLRGGPWAAVAAIPGTSNHGWARAIDITGYEGSATWRSPRTGRSYAVNLKVWNWLLAHAAEYGFDWATGDSSGEAWHWECLTAPGTAVASVDAVSLITKRPNEEDGMFIQAQGNTAYVYDGWYFQMAPDGKIQPLSPEQVSLAKFHGFEFAPWKAQDIYNHSVKAGMWDFTGKAGTTDPGYLTGLLLFGQNPDGSFVKKLPGQQYR